MEVVKLANDPKREVPESLIGPTINYSSDEEWLTLVLLIGM